MNITLLGNEQLIKDGKGVYLKSTTNVMNGTIYLTTERLVFNTNKSSGLFGAVSVLTDILSEGKNTVFVIKLSDLRRITKKKHGFGSKYILTEEGYNEYAIQFMSNASEWIELIINTIEQNTSNKVTMLNNDEYMIEPDRSILSSDDALAKLKKAKDKLDLGLISQAEFDQEKLQLGKFIN